MTKQSERASNVLSSSAHRPTACVYSKGALFDSGQPLPVFTVSQF